MDGGKGMDEDKVMENGKTIIVTLEKYRGKEQDSYTKGLAEMLPENYGVAP